MRTLALDIGEVRVGIAVSDADGTIAQPVCVLPHAEVMQNAKTFTRILQDWEPEVLLCGLPLTLAGDAGKQAQRIKTDAQAIANNTHLPLQFTDERLSSKEAKRILREQGLNEKKMRGRVDAVAASIFLQTWLDENKNAQSRV